MPPQESEIALDFNKDRWPLLPEELPKDLAKLKLLVRTFMKETYSALFF